MVLTGNKATAKLEYNASLTNEPEIWSTPTVKIIIQEILLAMIRNTMRMVIAISICVFLLPVKVAELAENLFRLRMTRMTEE